MGGTQAEQLIILGGSGQHVQPFSSGDPSDFVPHLLDLTTFEWRAAPQPATATTSAEAGDAAAFAPTPRMRFAAEVVGRFLVVYSGHGDYPIAKVRGGKEEVELRWGQR